ncbi:site-specific DNA-methyltransferase [Bradyrhizobium sp. Leo121]|uniref:DNA-methyltransferase n=1 Tax=Bradyrhizobium sp. Leo121 TaxID=1571195 RepID=UPI0026BE9EAF
MGSFYRSQHELVCVFKSGTGAHLNNIELGKHGRNRTNIWNYAGVSAFGSGRSDLALHPTVKPVALVEDAIRDCSRRKGIVLDPFLGSGTTLVAAERTGRIGYGIEIDPKYCDVILRRLQSLCGLNATLQGTGESFEQRQANALRGDESA